MQYYQSKVIRSTAAIRAMKAHINANQFNYRDKRARKFLHERIFHRRRDLQVMRTNDYEKFKKVVKTLKIDFDPAYEFKIKNKSHIRIKSV